jgi:hypothetical protein
MIEIEKDANMTKPLMASYLETLNGVIDFNQEDLDELRKIYAKVSGDRTVIQNIEAMLSEQITHLTNLVAKKGQIADTLAKAIRERKE